MSATIRTSQRSLIPWIFIGGMAVVVTVNIGMVVTAISSFSGLAHRDAFGRGVAYNRVIAAVERQEALGWRWQVSLVPMPGAKEALRLSLSDRDGLPLSGARIVAALERPVERAQAITVEFVETGMGHYAAGVALPQRGQWDVKLSILHAGDHVVAVHRIFAR